MSDTEPQPQDDSAESTPQDALNPEDLPPVEPPSAGFLVQLFFVPGVIVLVVVGLWALFGQLASGETDWRKLVTDIRSSNTHRRDRGAHGLAQLLANDANSGSSEKRLTRNPEIAKALVEIFEKSLKQTSPENHDIQHQMFLARTLGLLEQPARVVPVLIEGTDLDHDLEVRRGSLMSIAQIASRSSEIDADAKNTKQMDELLAVPSLVDALIDASNDREPTVAHLGTFALGLVPGDESRERLEVLLRSGDSKTRANAAIGLARQKSTEGLPLFADRFRAAAKPFVTTPFKPDPNDTPQEQAKRRQEHNQRESDREFEQFMVLKNALQAVSELNAELSSAQRKEMIDVIEPIAADFREPKIRIEAKNCLRTLRGAE